MSTIRPQFIFGGIDRTKKFLGDFSNSFFNFKKVEDPNTPRPRAFYSSVVMKDRYVIIHGRIYKKKALDDIIIFDIENKKWITPILNVESVVPRYMHKAIMYGNWMIVIGGNTRNYV